MTKLMSICILITNFKVISDDINVYHTIFIRITTYKNSL